MEINNEYEVKIIDCDNKGHGIAKIDNFVIFIKYAMLNEIVKIKIIDIKKNYAYGKIINIIKKSPERIDLLCKNYYKCGGCKFLHTKNEYENNLKENYIKKLFKNTKVNNIITNNKNNYRNKIELHVVNNKLGFYEEKTNNIIDIEDCYLIDEDIKKIIKKLKTINLKTIKEIVIRKSFYNNEIMLILDNNISKEDLNILKQDVDIIYINDVNIYGNKYLIDTIGEYYYKVYPKAFFQINNEMAKKMYDQIKLYAQKGNNLLDLYCGLGTIGIYLSDNFNKVIGIETCKDSIKGANENKTLNKVNNIEFINKDAKNIPNIKYDVIIVDPPRKGLSKEVINKINNLKVKKLIYVSCNPNTLKRDIELLKNYKLEEITPVNMFLHTKHVECVCMLNLLNNKKESK